MNRTELLDLSLRVSSAFIGGQIDLGSVRDPPSTPSLASPREPVPSRSGRSLRRQITINVSVIAETAMSSTRIERAAYKGWPNCWKIANRKIQLTVDGDVAGLTYRFLFGFAGGQNLFARTSP